MLEPFVTSSPKSGSTKGGVESSYASDPMMNFTEKDLVRGAEDAGFARFMSSCGWTSNRGGRRNPKAHTIGEALQQPSRTRNSPVSRSTSARGRGGGALFDGLPICARSRRSGGPTSTRPVTPPSRGVSSSRPPSVSSGQGAGCSPSPGKRPSGGVGTRVRVTAAAPARLWEADETDGVVGRRRSPPESRVYWIASVRPDGLPHCPSDGIWLDDACTSGAAPTPSMRNVRATGRAVAHGRRARRCRHRRRQRHRRTPRLTSRTPRRGEQHQVRGLRDDDAARGLREHRCHATRPPRARVDPYPETRRDSSSLTRPVRAWACVGRSEVDGSSRDRGLAVRRRSGCAAEKNSSPLDPKRKYRRGGRCRLPMPSRCTCRSRRRDSPAARWFLEIPARILPSSRRSRARARRRR